MLLLNIFHGGKKVLVNEPLCYRCVVLANISSHLLSILQNCSMRPCRIHQLHRGGAMSVTKSGESTSTTTQQSRTKNWRMALEVTMDFKLLNPWCRLHLWIGQLNKWKRVIGKCKVGPPHGHGIASKKNTEEASNSHFSCRFWSINAID